MYGGDVLVQNERSAMNCPSCLWPKSDSGSVLVPYTIDSRYSEFPLFSLALKYLLLFVICRNPTFYLCFQVPVT